MLTEKAATDNILKNGCGCVSIKLYLKKKKNPENMHKIFHKSISIFGDEMIEYQSTIY